LRVCRSAVLATALAMSAAVAAQDAPTSPEAILAAARQALGGDKRLAEVRTLVANGRTRQIRGDNLIPIEFEISCELPDKYIRRDEFPAQDAGPATAGFNSNLLIQIPPPQAPTMIGGPGGPPPPTAAQVEAGRNTRLNALKQDFARLMLGLFAGSFRSFPLTFTYVGIAEAPQGQADVLDVKGPADFAAQFFVSKTTRLPIMVSWRAPAAGPPRGGPPSPNAARGSEPSAAGPPPPSPATTRGSPPNRAGGQNPVETRLYFADYRDVDGIIWPFRIRRAIGADTVEETTFDRFRVNAKIDPKKFEAR
jgi:hypothetical protein